MIDRLLGRAELKERIETLEEEKEHLERRAEAEGERRSEAVADRQRAEERVNQLEDRIESLEDRVDRAESDVVTVEFRRVSDASGDRLADVLDRLRGIRSADPEGVLSAFVPDDDAVPTAVSDWFGDRSRLVRRAAPAVVVADDTGAVSVALSPPIAPEPFDEWSDAPRLDPTWFRPTGRFAFALVRSDTFALGVYEGDERVDFEGFDSDVKDAHSKGGFSQGRFERRREGQIDDHLKRARSVLDGVEDVDRTIVVGERSVLGDVREHADYTDVTDATGRPKEALHDAFRDFWTVRVHAI
ncbi:peptide subunit release factor 1 (eRF1) [Halorubrum alkaliphilum]|uniref:Peptide subunit release factor 1 (ERF1) n=1 Tax=Halorubrum alkaliphilum TaxID=261290 RepID=A0A8T4GCR5_9EURY|nr:Vms1/Ankzf1 family peptidyl-tRNA hydrolase [Halorubrum alkaliphilum]MBP1921062.1 peptide subunit release factor 1 (eRF1) [Halorubrum alkaliphilum]